MSWLSEKLSSFNVPWSQQLQGVERPDWEEVARRRSRPSSPHSPSTWLEGLKESTSNPDNITGHEFHDISTWSDNSYLAVRSASGPAINRPTCGVDYWPSKEQRCVKYVQCQQSVRTLWHFDCWLYKRRVQGRFPFSIRPNLLLECRARTCIQDHSVPKGRNKPRNSVPKVSCKTKGCGKNAQCCVG
jgi:hypothetical protein